MWSRTARHVIEGQLQSSAVRRAEHCASKAALEESGEQARQVVVHTQQHTQGIMLSGIIGPEAVARRIIEKVSVATLAEDRWQVVRHVHAHCV
jgi:hypothetical protein